MFVNIFFSTFLTLLRLPPCESVFAALFTARLLGFRFASRRCHIGNEMRIIPADGQKSRGKMPKKFHPPFFCLFRLLNFDPIYSVSY
jgi:hypothetical protein